MKRAVQRKKSKGTAHLEKRRRRHGRWVSERDFARLTNSLREAQDTLDAIRNGEVDAVVVHGPRGHQIYSLTGADQPYRVYVERMQEGAVTVSDTGLVLYANRRFAEMLHQPLERVIGAMTSSFLDAVAWKEIVAVLGSQQGFTRCETDLLSAGGKTLPVTLTASHLPLEGENVLCLVVTDLSAQKQNEELRLAKEVAERANEAKDAFLATLSHELRTPLNPALLIASEAANDVSLPPAVRADFATISDNIELEARLIDDLLDLTRIINDKLALKMEEFDCRVALSDAIDTIRTEINKKGLSLRIKVEKQPCLVNADPVRLKQALWNVLKNAVKFTPENGQIAIDLQCVPDQPRLQIKIADSGIGITRKESREIFEAFSQGEHARRKHASPFGGLGLGLSITRKIVDLHSGEIRAHSEGRDKGSTFTIELPMTQPIAKSEAAGRPVMDSGPAEVLPNRYSILLVEDHGPTREALTNLLARRQHRVATASSAREARSLAEKDTFHLIISDIGLPDGNGFDLMKELGARYSLKGIALTGYGMEHDVKESRAAGFIAHLTKPVRIEALELALADVMGAPVRDGSR